MKAQYKKRSIWFFILIGALIGFVLILPLVYALEKTGVCPDQKLINRGFPCSSEDEPFPGQKCENGLLYATNPPCITNGVIKSIYGTNIAPENMGYRVTLIFPIFGIIGGALIGLLVFSISRKNDHKNAN